MWRMSDGDRVLTEAEWALFAAGLDVLFDFVEDDIRDHADMAEFGVSSFDRLTPEQKLALLADVARALRDPAVPTPRHTAANEGAIASVFAAIRFELDAELDVATALPDGDDEPREMRRLLLAVVEQPWEGEDPLPDISVTDVDEWDWLVEMVENRIFWDADFEMGDTFLDLPPDVARAHMELAGIDPDYFLDVPDDPGEAGLIAARQTLARMLDRPVPGDDGLYPGFMDYFHDLIVGDCSPDEIAALEGHPWVQHIHMGGIDWDCDYATWKTLFGPAVPAEPFDLTAGAEPAGEVPDGVVVERRGESWVVRKGEGEYWCGATEDMWTASPDDEDDYPVLTFPTAAAAESAIVRASQMYAERAERRNRALEQLGVDDESDSCDDF